MHIEIKKLTIEDISQFKGLLGLFEDVFKMDNFRMPEQNYLRQLLDKDSFFVFVALSDGNIIAGLTAYTLQQYYSELPLVYLYDLAVKTDFQRRGIGKMLVSALLKYCKGIGAEEVFVQADEIDTHALEFYRSAGGKAQNVVHFTYPL